MQGRSTYPLLPRHFLDFFFKIKCQHLSRFVRYSILIIDVNALLSTIVCQILIEIMSTYLVSVHSFSAFVSLFNAKYLLISDLKKLFTSTYLRNSIVLFFLYLFLIFYEQLGSDPSPQSFLYFQGFQGSKTSFVIDIRLVKQFL